MKRSLVLALMLLVVAPAATESVARPAYCDVALLDCARKCRAKMPILWEGCVIGCEIGYLFCGGSPF